MSESRKTFKYEVVSALSFCIAAKADPDRFSKAEIPLQVMREMGENGWEAVSVAFDDDGNVRYALMQWEIP
jgi:hypothetical protein